MLHAAFLRCGLDAVSRACTGKESTLTKRDFMLPITLRNVALFLPHKICFERVSLVLSPGSRVGLMGQNGCGKSTLLRILCGLSPCPEGDINIPSNINMAYVPQAVPESTDCSGVQHSGGESLYHALSEAFAQKPDVLLLDEPSNHLDQQHRAGLLRLIKAYGGTLIIASHDAALLRDMETLWHIHDGKLSVFGGNFDDYLVLQQKRHAREEAEERSLRQQKKKLKEAIQKKQTKAARGKHQGAKKFGNDKMQLGTVKNWGEQSSGKALQRMHDEQKQVEKNLKNRRRREELQPKFQIYGEAGGQKNIVTIADGTVLYDSREILRKVSLAISSNERIALHGNNGSGKSTLLQAIMHSPEVIRKGFWDVPPHEQVCYLDQRYSLLQNAKENDSTVLEIVHEGMPNSAYVDVRRHLNNFLFRKNEEVNCQISLLSGGERARLCLAVLAARSPQLLLLDEMTNNLDRETRQHVISVLQEFPGALILVSHDKDFLDAVGITTHYHIHNSTLHFSQDQSSAAGTSQHNSNFP